LSNREKIKAVFFDLGNTLVTEDDFLKNEAPRLDQKLLKSIGHDIPLGDMKKSIRKTNDYLNSKFRGDSKIYEKGFFLFVMCRFLGLNVDREVAEKLGEKFIEKHFESFKLLPNAIEILSFLKDKDYKLVIISNGSIDGVNKVIDKFDLRKYFDLIIISEEVGREKSTTIPIKLALEKSGLTVDEALMIGDRIDEDILGAKKLGMIAVKYNYGIWKDSNYSGEDVKSDFVINDLLELKEILHELDNR